MTYENTNRHVSDEERRKFLKVLGVGGAVASGSATLSEVRDAYGGGTEADLAPIGQAIRADLAGELNAELLASQQSAIAERATGLTTVSERGFPESGPREDFASVAAAARPIYDHLATTGFFESTTEHLPEFTPEYLEESVQAFVGSEALAEPLDRVGFSGEEGVDMLATVIANAEELATHHWIATDAIPREQVEFGDAIPSMTRGAAGGALLWLEDLDTHLWQKQVLLTDEILSDAAWHGKSMAAGLQLMAEGARAVAAGNAELTNDQLGALLSTGFAVQAIAQNLLPQDVYWVTEEMRDLRRTDLETVHGGTRQ